MPDHSEAVQREQEMRAHEREARERAEGSDADEDPSLGTPDSDANPAPPGNVQGANLGGAS